MSVKAMTHVFQHSRASGNDRVVALVLADHASDDGTGAYPSQAMIASKANCAERTVRDCLDRLEAMGEITRRGVHPSHKTVIFDLILTPADSAPGKSCRPRQPAAAKPSTEKDIPVPPEFLPALATVKRVVEGKRAKPIKHAPFVRICTRYSDRDLVVEAEKFEHYYLHGAGENRKRKDVLAAWRNWLDNAPSALANKRGGREHPADRRIRESLRQAGVAA